MPAKAGIQPLSRTGSPLSRGRAEAPAVPSTSAVIVPGRFGRHIALRYIPGKRGAIAPGGIAVAPAACALQEEAIVRRHIVPAGRGLALDLCAELGYETRGDAGLAACETFGRKTRLVDATHDRGVFQNFVLALQAQ